MASEIVWLEWKLILRNRAARYLVIAGPTLVTALAILMLNFPGPSTDVAEILYLACLFTPITYASLAFSWNATNWASLFQLPVAPRDHIEGRLLVSASLSIPPLITLTAFSLWLRPELAVLPLVSGIFGVTVVSLPFFLVSVRTPKSVDANAPPLADSKKFGWQHWVAGLLVVGPGIVLIRFITFEQFASLLGITGILGLAALPIILRYGFRVFERSIPELSNRLLDG